MNIKRFGLSVILALSVVLFFKGSTDPQQPAGSQASAAPPQIQNFSQLPMYFIKNSGQLDESIAYHLKMPGGNVHFARDSIRYQFVSSTGKAEPTLAPKPEEYRTRTEPVSVETLNVRFEGAGDSVEVLGVGEHEARFNFYQGAEPESWVEGTRSFAKVKYKNLYSKIDMVVYEHKDLLKQEYKVRPGGLVSDICVAYEGARSIRVNDRGQLEILTPSRTLVEDTPVSYQIIGGNKFYVEMKYVVDERNKVRFEVGYYDDSNALIIDPSLIYSTFLGGFGGDNGNGIAIDLHLNAYVVGFTYSDDFPTSGGAQNGSLNRPDVFLTKLNSSGTEILFSTLLGGSGWESEGDIAFSWDDECAVITGRTNSSDFPTTRGAYDRNLGGERDIFIAKFDSEGALVFSTLFGGWNDEYCPHVALDGIGNIFVYGVTLSSNFPTTPGVIDRRIDPGPDGYLNYYDWNLFLTKFVPDGSSLVYSTLFGEHNLTPNGISVDFAGNAFIIGTCRRDGQIPTTPNAYQELPNESGDSYFVASINPTGTQLNYSTYLGSRRPSGISVDGKEAFISGQNIGLHWKAFVCGLNAKGSRMLFDREFDECSGGPIAVDGRGSMYVVFVTSKPGLPISPDAIQPYNGLSDLYVVKLKTSDGSTEYSTYLGGNKYDYVGGLTVDSFGSAYLTGSTFSFDFPTTAGAFCTTYHQKGYSHLSDAFVTRIRDFGPAGKLNLSKAKLSFKIPFENTDTVTKNFWILNKGKGVVNYDISTNQKWLSVDPPSGDVRNEQDNVDVSVTPANLKPGTHYGIVKVSSVDAFNSPAQLPVKLKVNGPTIRVKRKKYSLDVEEGSTTTISLANKIKNKGPGELRYKLKSLESWIKVTPKRGTSTGEWDPFSIEVDPSGLDVGIHQGIIQVISKDTVDSPFDITITLNIKVEDASDGEVAL
jgi:hypothetical protein